MKLLYNSSLRGKAEAIQFFQHVATAGLPQKLRFLAMTEDNILCLKK